MAFDFFDPTREFLILDGAMGTVLQQRGLPPGGQPELLNLTDPALLRSVHRQGSCRRDRRPGGPGHGSPGGAAGAYGHPVL